MHWNRTNPVPVLHFSSPGLREVPTTTLTRSGDTVALNKSKVPAMIGWLLFAGVAGLALSRRSTHRATYVGPDALDELVAERARILQRVTSRPKKRRTR